MRAAEGCGAEPDGLRNGRIATFVRAA